MSQSNGFLIAGALLLVVVVACTTFLTSIDKIDGALFMGVVVGPIVGGIIGAIAGVKGVQSGSQATIAPPPDA